MHLVCPHAWTSAGTNTARLRGKTPWVVGLSSVQDSSGGAGEDRSIISAGEPQN